MNFKTSFLIAITAIFVVLFSFFAPQYKDKKVDAGDAISSTAWSKHLMDYKEESGISSNWNPSMFSGMPWGLLSAGVKQNLVFYVNKVFYFFQSYPSGYFIKAAITCFITLVFLGVNPLIASIFSLLFSLSVNHIILLEAGHGNKVDVLTVFPAILGSTLLILRRKYFSGAAIFTLALSTAIMRNHIQMVYYLALAMLIFVIAYSIISIKNKSISIKGLISSGAVLILCAAIAALSNFAQLYSSKKFSEDTMRGTPTLQKKDVSDQQESSNVEGLAWDYAMNWSNDKTSLLTLLVPRVMGGGSGEYVNGSTATGKLLKQNGAKRAKNKKYRAPMYWGSMPFTSGPDYFGVYVFFLFVIGMFLLKKEEKWPFLFGAITIALLSLGKNFEILNRFLFDHFPLFNKFRSPGSALNVLASFLIIPAALSQQKIFENLSKQDVFKALRNAFFLLGGLLLLFILLGSSLFSFTGASDANYNAQILDIFIETRKELLYNDALRSLGLLVVIFVLTYLYLKDFLKNKYLYIVLVGCIALFDVWQVGKGYLTEDSWVSEKKYEYKFSPRPVDNQIFQLEPKGRGFYRVLDLSINTFNSAHTSYHHNTVGGYHAAKLQRYQDMIDYHISKFNLPVLNMLNAKYIINQNGQLQVNSQALGNAWFVKDIQKVDDPNQEIEAMSNETFKSDSTAIILTEEFKNQYPALKAGDAKGQISLTEYAPNKLTYSSSSSSDQLAVFSEVWYGPQRGWKVFIDEKPVEMIRANYILRALPISAGNHKIVFEYTPVVYGAFVSNFASFLILLIIGFAVYKVVLNKEIV